MKTGLRIQKSIYMYFYGNSEIQVWYSSIIASYDQLNLCIESQIQVWIFKKKTIIFHTIN